MSKAIPHELKTLCEDQSIQIGQQRRIIHKRKADGEICSEGKDAAMTVKRVSKGFVFHCHRCGYEGFVGNDRMAPAVVKHMLLNLITKPVKEVKGQLILPVTKPLFKNTEAIPMRAYSWCWKSGITDDLTAKYEIGWSDHYKRVIIPIINDKGFYIGWVGRDVFSATKERRRSLGVPKYIIRKKEGEGRVFFTCFTESDEYDSMPVVVVEDILSAIRVHEATGWETVALLTTHYSDDILMKYLTRSVVLWLDNDQGINMLKVMTKVRSYGGDFHMLKTPKDPKGYSDNKIRTFLREKLDEASWKGLIVCKS